MTISHDLLRLKLDESWVAKTPALTRREVYLPGILRGRAMEVLVLPFSFREALRHAGTEPQASERQRMVNPRKAYPVDPALIELFERSGRTHQGRALETVVMLELERRGWEVTYVRTAEGWEVDFLAHRAGEPPLLVQVCLESEGDETWARELRGLEAAAKAHPQARPFLVTLDAVPPRRGLPEGLSWVPASRWLLEEM